MRTFLLLLLAVIAQVKNAEVNIEVGRITDTRTRDDAPAFVESGLHVELKLSGPAVSKAMLGRVILDIAKDDNGQGLQLVESHERYGFGSLYARSLIRSPEAGGGYRAASYGLKIAFSNPDRSARMIKELRGKLELLKSSDVAADVFSVPLQEIARNPKENAAAKAVGLRLEFGMAGENSISYEFTARESQIALVEFCDGIGNELRSQSHITRVIVVPYKKTGDEKNAVKFKRKVTFDRGLPADAVVKIYLATETSILTVPFVFKDIVLP